MAGESEGYKKLIEAALFVSAKALSADDIAKAVGIASIGYVSKLTEELAKDYEGRDTALKISAVGNKFIMEVKGEYASKVNELAGKPDLRQGALRILAYISKNEPVMQNSIVKVFGSQTYEYMKELVENDFVKTKRVGRTKKIETSEKFKEYFELS